MDIFRRNVFSAVIIVVLLFLISCDSSSQTAKKEVQNTLNERSNIIRVINGDGAEIASIEHLQDNVIFLEGNRIKSKIGSSGKRKYLDEGGNTIGKINKYDYGFKVKSLEGTILWKIKLKDESIKIANNDDMEGAYKVKKKSKTKIYVDEKEVGNAIEMESYIKVHTMDKKELKVFNTNELHAAIMGIVEIPLEIRLIMLAEISFE